MNDVNIIKNRIKSDTLEQIVGAQILFYCYNENIWLNKSEFDTMLHICMKGYSKTTTLSEIVKKGIFKSDQCVRNARGKLVKLGLLVEPKKRHFTINPKLNIYNSGKVMFDLKMININEA